MSDESVDDRPLDLSVLDPDIVSSVMRRVAWLPAHDPTRIDALWGLWSMTRGLAVAAALTLLIILTLQRPWQAMTPRRPATIAESLGVPPEFRDLLIQRGARQ